MLIPWLRSEDDTIRDWSAGTLGRLGASDAIPYLLDAWAAAKARGTPPDWTEPAQIRDALARLGARHVVLPAAAARLEAAGHSWDHAWPVSALPQVFRHLAEARQVILYFQYWAPYVERGADSWIGVDSGTTPELDWSQPSGCARGRSEPCRDRRCGGEQGSTGDRGHRGVDRRERPLGDRGSATHHDDVFRVLPASEQAARLEGLAPRAQQRAERAAPP